jgi:hypothetical protein
VADDGITAYIILYTDFEGVKAIEQYKAIPVYAPHKLGIAAYVCYIRV